MRKLFLAGFSLLYLVLSANLSAQEEIEILLRPAAELNFPTEVGKYYTVQSSLDMVNWSTRTIREGDGDDYRGSQLFFTPQRYTRVLVSTTPPAEKALADLTGKTLFLEKFVLGFPGMSGYEVFEESELISRTEGQTVPLAGEASVAYSYSLFRSSYNGSSFIRTLPAGVVEQFYLTYLSADEGRFFRITQVNGVETQTDSGNFRVEDTAP